MADKDMAASEGGTRETGAGESKIGQLLSDGSLGRPIHVPAGTSLYEADAPATNIYFLHDGQVRIFLQGPKRSAQLVEILGSGDWFGIPALCGTGRASTRAGHNASGAPPATYGMRAVAVTGARVSEVPADKLMISLQDHHAIARELIAQLAIKLQAAYGHSANLVFDDTEKRLIKALLQFSRTSAATPVSLPDGNGIELRITHQQLAQAVGAARETVSLTLTQLRQQNLLRTGRNRLSFNPTALEDFSRRSDDEGVKPAKENENAAG